MISDCQPRSDPGVASSRLIGELKGTTNGEYWLRQVGRGTADADAKAKSETPAMPNRCQSAHSCAHLDGERVPFGKEPHRDQGVLGRPLEHVGREPDGAYDDIGLALTLCAHAASVAPRS